VKKLNAGTIFDLGFIAFDGLKRCRSSGALLIFDFYHFYKGVAPLGA